MKKLITILSITVLLFGSTANAQVITAQGKTVTLTIAQINYLKGLKVECITKALTPGNHIRNND